MLEFPKADRKLIGSFNSNYLKTIIFQIKFPSTEKAYETKNSYLNLFKDLYPRISESQQNGFEISISKDHTPILQPIPSEKNGVELRSEDGQKILAILKDGINLTINGSVYKNFDHIISELNLLKEVLQKIGVDKIIRVAIRKINIIDFEIPPAMPDTYSVGIMQLLLHPELLNNMTYFPSQKNIIQSIHNVLYRKDDTTLNLKYGVIQSNILEKKGQVLVDIDLFKISDITNENILNVFREINIEIFNIFNWAMKPEAIQHLMSQKND